VTWHIAIFDQGGCGASPQRCRSLCDFPRRQPRSADPASGQLAQPGVLRPRLGRGKELERVFDICHGCRRCVSLCNTFPTLFDLIDASKTGEIDGVAKADYAKVVDQCYLCDVCYRSNAHVPPHPWNVDFPHLMLRAKARKFRSARPRFAIAC
jgi:hypothetical protein